MRLMGGQQRREKTKSFGRNPDVLVVLHGLAADVQRDECNDPRNSAETYGSVAAILKGAANLVANGE
jgi:hypothetical protein